MRVLEISKKYVDDKKNEQWRKLSVEGYPPEVRNNYPRGGYFVFRISEGDKNTSIIINEEQAALIVMRLTYILNKFSEEFSEVFDEYREDTGKKGDNEAEEDEK